VFARFAPEVAMNFSRKRLHGVGLVACLGLLVGCSASTGKAPRPARSPNAVPTVLEVGAVADRSIVVDGSRSGPAPISLPEALRVNASVPTNPGAPWSAEVAASIISDAVDPRSLVNDSPRAVNASSYPLDTALDDFGTFFNALPGRQTLSYVSGYATGISATLRAIDAHWVDISSETQAAIKVELGLDSPSASTAVAAPRASGTGDCSAFEAHLKVVKAELTRRGVSDLPGVRLSCNVADQEVTSRTATTVRTVAYSLPGGSLGAKQAPCMIWFNPDSARQPLNVVAREYWHCVQSHAAQQRFHSARAWLVEGQAAYLGWTFEKDTEAWDRYLANVGAVPITDRSDDAIGFYIQRQYVVGSVERSVTAELAEMWRYPVDDLAQFALLTNNEPEFQGTWASSSALAPTSGDGWQTETGYSTAGQLAPVVRLTVSSEKRYRREAFTPGRAMVVVDGGVDVLAVNVPSGWGRISDVASGGTTNTSAFGNNTVVLCGPAERGSENRCACPNQPAGEVTPPALGAGNELQIAIAGTTAPGEIVVQALGIEDYCVARYAPIALAETSGCRYLSNSDIEPLLFKAVITANNDEEIDNGGINCQINAVPVVHPITETERVINVYLTVVTARPSDPDHDAASAVASLGKDATAYPIAVETFQTVAPYSTSGSRLVFPCGRRWCVMTVVAGDRPAVADESRVTADAIQLAQLLRRRVR
jgi:hypothetical protein